jgi:hypothetical protein
VYRRVLYTFADVPLNAGRLIASQVASTALQEHQRRSQERGFDDGEHAPSPLHKLPIVPLRQARRRGRRHPPCRQKMDDDDPQKAGENVAQSGLHEPGRRSARLTVRDIDATFLRAP